MTISANSTLFKYYSQCFPDGVMSPPKELGGTAIRMFDEILLSDDDLENFPSILKTLKVGGSICFFTTSDIDIAFYLDGCEYTLSEFNIDTYKVYKAKIIAKVFNFDSYEQYKDLNVSTHKRKADRGIIPNKYMPVINILKTKSNEIGICHGARNNLELDIFKKHLGCKVIGTDISDDAARFSDDMIVMDFHEIKDEWIDSIDFIYCNALDHSHSPKYAVSQWIRCLKPDGLLFIEYGYDKWAAGYNAADCFGATYEGYQKMFDGIGCIKDIINIQDISIFVLKKVDIDLGVLPSLNRFAK